MNENETNFRIIPRLDIKDKNLIKSINFEGLRKVGPINRYPINYYNQGADELIFMDPVSSLFSKKIIYEILHECSKNIFIPITIGGGIKNLKDAKKILAFGGDKVALNTAAVLKPKLIKELSDNIGSQSVVSYIEAKKVKDSHWEVYINNGKDKTGIDVMRWVEKLNKLGAGELLISSVDMEGTKKGFDKELYNKISEATDLPIIVNGGFGRLEDLTFFRSNKKLDSLALSSTIHYDLFTINDIKNFSRKIGLNVRK